MKKFIVFLSSVALVGSVSYAMDEEAAEGEMMDEAMAMEAPAPSVAVSGSAAIGIINDSTADESLQLINEYKVSFSSSGTTDGGLMFGAGIAIEDTHDKDPEKSVKNSHVYVGGADGSWKVQFGGNDPGIDLVGAIGIAGDHLGRDDEDATIALSGNFGGSNFRLSMSDPAYNPPERGMMEYKPDPRVVPGIWMDDGLDSPDIPSTYSYDSVSDLEYFTALEGVASDAAAIKDVLNENIQSFIDITDTIDSLEDAGVDTDNYSEQCGVTKKIYYVSGVAITGFSWDHDDDDNTPAVDLDYANDENIPIAIYEKWLEDVNNNAPAGLKQFEVYSAEEYGDHLRPEPAVKPCIADHQDNREAEATRDSTVQITPAVPMMMAKTDAGTAYYAGMNKNNQWSVGLSHAIDAFNIGVGMDSGKGLALSLGTEMSGINVGFYYSKSEFDNVYLGTVFEPGNFSAANYEIVNNGAQLKAGSTIPTYKDITANQENTGLGVSASMSVGDGATFSVAYSTLKREVDAEGKAHDSSTTDKKIELDVSYALGGGATLNAGIDKIDDDGKESQTKLEAQIAMKF